VRRDRDEHEHAGRRIEPERKPDLRPVDKAVDREAGGAERPHLMVRPRLLRVVAVVQHQQPLDQEEGEEAGADQGRGRLGVADRVDRLGQHVEQRDGHHDPARERNHCRQVVRQPERDLTSHQRRCDR
jgi:hypothetical protein